MMRAQVRDRLRRGSGEAKKQGGSARPAASGVAEGPRLIVHVDMDAFFAAIEERDNPALAGHPVIVGGPKGSRGIVTTANYVARRYGIRSGMPLAEAERLCPRAHHVSTSGGKYTWVSLQLMELLRNFSPTVEPASVDEAYLDATGCLDGEGEEAAACYGRQLQEAIRRELGLSASVGMGSSRIIAKIASGMNKPGGLTVIPAGEEADLLGGLPVEEVPGVGPASRKALVRMGILAIGDLLRIPRTLLKQRLGKHAVDLQKRLQGEAGREVTTPLNAADDKSMGHEHTFGSDVQSMEVLNSELLELSDRVSRRLRRAGYLGRVVTLKLRTRDFHTRDHQRALASWSDDPAAIHQLARQLLDDLWKPGDLPVRLIGVSVSGLLRLSHWLGLQRDLFEGRQRGKRDAMLKAVDELRDEYGEAVLCLAGSLLARKQPRLREVRRRSPG